VGLGGVVFMIGGSGAGVGATIGSLTGSGGCSFTGVRGVVFVLTSLVVS